MFVVLYHSVYMCEVLKAVKFQQVPSQRMRERLVYIIFFEETEGAKAPAESFIKKKPKQKGTTITAGLQQSRVQETNKDTKKITETKKSITVVASMNQKRFEGLV